MAVEGVYFDTIAAHVERHFGPSDQVFHELVSEFVHVDLLPVPPAPGRPYWLIVTAGMSDRAMTVNHPGLTDEAARDAWDRAELMLALPADWAADFADLQTEERFYPLGGLKNLARYPHGAATFLAPGHTIDIWLPGDQTATELTGALIDWPYLWPEEAGSATAPDGEVIHFYMVYPLHPEEVVYKLREGSEALLMALDRAGALRVFDPARPPAVAR